MAASQRDLFLTIKTEGAILPTDLLQRIVEGDSELGGLTSDAYHLGGGEKLTEATSRSWNRLLGAWSVFQSAREKLSDGDSRNQSRARALGVTALPGARLRQAVIDQSD